MNEVEFKVDETIQVSNFSKFPRLEIIVASECSRCGPRFEAPCGIVVVNAIYVTNLQVPVAYERLIALQLTGTNSKSAEINDSLTATEMINFEFP